MENKFKGFINNHEKILTGALAVGLFGLALLFLPAANEEGRRSEERYRSACESRGGLIRIRTFVSPDFGSSGAIVHSSRYCDLPTDYGLVK